LPAKTPFNIARGQVSALSRYRTADDPVLIAARARLDEERLFKSITLALQTGPAVTPALRARIDEILGREVVAA
jgi:hypothetical protein